jgi:alcohol dehydrogenase, propanol-preferring
VPDGIDPREAAPLTCAGVTTYKAVKLSGARPASLVAVWGVGGLGHMALQYARSFGASVVAVDLHDDKLATARELGADYTINASTQDAVAELTKLGGADAAVVTAVSPGWPAAARSCSSGSPPATRCRSRSSRPC